MSPNSLRVCPSGAVTGLLLPSLCWLYSLLAVEPPRGRPNLPGIGREGGVKENKGFSVCPLTKQPLHLTQPYLQQRAAPVLQEQLAPSRNWRGSHAAHCRHPQEPAKSQANWRVRANNENEALRMREITGKSTAGTG